MFCVYFLLRRSVNIYFSIFGLARELSCRDSIRYVTANVCCGNVDICIKNEREEQMKDIHDA